MMHCWIQIELTEKLKLEEEEGIELEDGYHYVDPEMQGTMVEFHMMIITHSNTKRTWPPDSEVI
jgi:hypothetical protein